MRNLTQRLLAEVFRLKAIEVSQREDNFIVSVATLEIYNDHIRDLNPLPGAPVSSVFFRGHQATFFTLVERPTLFFCVFNLLKKLYFEF